MARNTIQRSLVLLAFSLFVSFSTPQALSFSENVVVGSDGEDIPSLGEIYRQLDDNNATCNRFNGYLGSKNECILKPFRSVLRTNRTAMTNTRNNFRVIMVSDIQFYVSTCRGNPVEECIYNNGTKTRRRTLNTAVDLHRDFVVSLNDKFDNVAAVFDLGDLTDAIPSPWNLFAISNVQNINAIRKFHNDISVNIGKPGVTVLGNHDYQIARDVNAIRSLQYLRERMLILSRTMNIRSLDFVSTPTLEGSLGLKLKYSRGSLSYSFEIEGIVFIVLHWAYEDYTVDPPNINYVNCATGNPFVRTIIGRDPLSRAHFHQVDITNATAWMLREVSSAALEGKKIVLVPHGSGGLLEFVDKSPLVKQILTSAPIAAVINGHTHDAYGLEKYWKLGEKKIPVYYVGSSSYQKLSMFDFYPERETTDVTKITVYDSKDGSSCKEATATSTTTDGADGGGFACDQPPASANVPNQPPGQVP